jgi:hypothetical protein
MPAHPGYPSLHYEDLLLLLLLLLSKSLLSLPLYLMVVALFRQQYQL